LKKIILDKIPGQIEPIEQELLLKYSSLSNLSLGYIVEIGCFFGKSTACLINGLLKNPSFNNQISIYVFDSFKTTVGKGFDQYVEAAAKKSNLTNALLYKDNMIDFRNIFSFFMAGHEHKTIHVQEVFLKELKPFIHPISLLFIDAPKSYYDLKYVLENFFIKLQKGSVIIFQDFFYHWSNGLIAAISLMFSFNKISFIETAASSLVVNLVEGFTEEDIISLDEKMKNKQEWNTYIDDIKNIFNLKTMDRYYQFFPRIITSQIQQTYEIDDKNNLSKYVKELFENSNFMNNQTVNDIFELILYKFKLPRE